MLASRQVFAGNRLASGSAFMVFIEPTGCLTGKTMGKLLDAEESKSDALATVGKVGCSEQIVPNGGNKPKVSLKIPAFR